MCYWALCPLIAALMNSICFMVTYRMNFRMVSGMMGAVYRKSQRLPASVPDYTLVSDRQNRLMDEGNYQEGITKYSLVQLVNTDIGGHLTGLQLALCRLITLVPTVLIMIVLVCTRVG